MSEKKTICHEFYVDGMHCAACEILIEKKLTNHSKVKKVKASLSKEKIIVEGNFEDEENIEELAKELSSFVEKEGYKVTLKKSIKKSNLDDFIFAVPIGLTIIILFILSQKLGLINFINTAGETLPLPVIFLIGIVASLSSCMAVVGGLVLSMAATYAKESRTGKNISQISFHLGRIISFFILGGLLGIIGASFKLSTTIYFILDLIIAVVMIILAINMMDIFPVFKKLQPRMPKFLSRKALNIEAQDKGFLITPILVGAATFFLPCGFTQSMQLYALSTGNFWGGASTMMTFALGTLPILALVSFASITLSKSNKAGIFFKTAGIIVLFFALLNILGALALMGIIEPILNI